MRLIVLLFALFILSACSTEEVVPEVEEVPIQEEVSLDEETEHQEFSQDYSTFETLEEVVIATIQEFELNQNAVSVAYYNYVTAAEYYLNERELMLAGSTTKVGLARLFADKIAEGDLSLQSELPYSDSLYEPGAGRVTNGEKKAAYPLYELLTHSLAQSDNTAFNILFFYYQQTYGNVQQALLELSGLEFSDANATTNNMADAQMLLNILRPIATEDKYSYILTALSGNTEANYFRTYVQDGMYTKYGSINGSLHDTGIYIKDGQPVYALVVMINGQGSVDEFLGTINLRINEWTDYQQANAE